MIASTPGRSAARPTPWFEPLPGSARSFSAARRRPLRAARFQGRRARSQSASLGSTRRPASCRGNREPVSASAGSRAHSIVSSPLRCGSPLAVRIGGEGSAHGRVRERSADALHAGGGPRRRAGPAEPPSQRGSPPGTSRRSALPRAQSPTEDDRVGRTARRSSRPFSHRARTPGLRCLARSTNRRYASSGPSGSNLQTLSPSTPSNSRLVAMIRTFGQKASNAAASSAHASTTCSQLSSTSSGARSRKYRRSASVAVPPR